MLPKGTAVIVPNMGLEGIVVGHTTDKKYILSIHLEINPTWTLHRACFPKESIYAYLSCK